ncbi:hypothetical protein IV203_033020 [Nitzschia inconspicua]|uniref:Uncharacterized protein n=1 Tax=Nitzschia inconspicua TaxID=303405 RepID=A0A9K3KLS6_9STRA|nr:hypothetical protein IV203_033020 [Nitzschia inconspicua]
MTFQARVIVPLALCCFLEWLSVTHFCEPVFYMFLGSPPVLPLLVTKAYLLVLWILTFVWICIPGTEPSHQFQNDIKEYLGYNRQGNTTTKSTNPLVDVGFVNPFHLVFVLLWNGVTFAALRPQENTDASVPLIENAILALFFWCPLWIFGIYHYRFWATRRLHLSLVIVAESSTAEDRANEMESIIIL